MIFSRARFTPSSAYSLSSIIARSRDRYEANYNMDGDAPVVSIHAGAARRTVISCCQSLLLEPALLRNSEAGSAGWPCTIRVYPGSFSKEYGTRAVASCFEIAEQPELEGYAYLAEDLAQLKGNRYVSKKTGSTRCPGSMSIRDG